MIDLDNFPTSPAAKRMMKTVSPIYDKAYVGKWIFQVMGLEMDSNVGYSLLGAEVPHTARR